MKRLLFCIILYSNYGFARPDISTTYERGFFSLGLLSGYSQSRTLNSDSTFSKFSGASYGFQLEVSLTQLDSGDIRLLGNWSHDDLKEKAGTYKLQGDSIGGGLKFYANRTFFLQTTYGEIRQKYESTDFSYSVKNKYLAVALGADFPITESLLLGASVQYTTNPIKKTPSISSNSFSEAGQVFLLLTWSPPITVINTTAPKLGR